MRTLSRTRKLICLFSTALVIAFAISAVSGRVSISIADIVKIFSNFYHGKTASVEFLPKELVFLWIRLPRCIMAVLVGISLAMSGAVIPGPVQKSPGIAGYPGGIIRMYFRGGSGADPPF